MPFLLQTTYRSHLSQNIGQWFGRFGSGLLKIFRCAIDCREMLIFCLQIIDENKTETFTFDLTGRQILVDPSNGPLPFQHYIFQFLREFYKFLCSRTFSFLQTLEINSMFSTLIPIISTKPLSIQLMQTMFLQHLI